jgi:hypothetical protein
MLVSNPGLLQLWHWQTDVLTTRLHLILSHTYEKRGKLWEADLLAYALSYYYSLGMVPVPVQYVPGYAVCHEIC